MSDITIAGVINARLLSSRLPRKLVLPFAGTTLVDIALGKLSRAEGLDNRFFAVAEDELAQRVSSHPGVTLLRRDSAAVQPGYNAHEKIFEHYRWIDADYIFWINPCAPLLSFETIRRTCDFVRSTRHNSYTAVVETRDWIFNAEGLPVTNRQPAMLSTAHSEKFYRVAHMFHVMNREFFLRSFVPWTLTQHDPELVRIPDEENFDVNTRVEFQVAEAAYAQAVGARTLE